MNLKDINMLNKICGKDIIHVECPHITEKKFIAYCKRVRPLLFCITPANYQFVQAEFGLDGLTPEEFSETLTRIYKELKGVCQIQLHVHISQFPKRVPNKRKRELIENAYYFMKNKVGITPTKIVFGWFSYDEDCKKISEKLDLNIIENHFHIYDRDIKPLEN